MSGPVRTARRPCRRGRPVPSVVDVTSTRSRTSAPGIGGLCTAAAAMTAAMAITSAAATLVAGDALGSRWPGLPATAGIVGTGVGALLLPRVIGRGGRRRGLLKGYGVAL